jgi:hypothetical protein
MSGGTIALIVVLVVLVGCGGSAAALWYVGKNVHSANGPTTTSTPPVIATTTAPPTPADIFAGTAVGAYADGADGIVVPTAEATKLFSKSKVAADLAIVKQALVASRLDPKVLTNHDPSAFLALIAQDDRTGVAKDVQDPTKVVPYLTEIDPSGSLTNDPIKVAGSMTFTQSTDSQGIRQLSVTTNYVFVYPFAGTRTTVGDHLAVVHDKTVWTFAYDGDVQSTSRGLWIDSGFTNVYSVDCTAFNQGLILVGPLTSNPSAAFDPNTPVDNSGGDC